MSAKERVSILLVDDQPGKLLTYEAMLHELDENLIKASSGKEALSVLLKNEVAVVLLDVSMPEIDGFELAQMVRQHPRFDKTAIIFVSAVQVNELDLVKREELEAVKEMARLAREENEALKARIEALEAKGKGAEQPSPGPPTM